MTFNLFQFKDTRTGNDYDWDILKNINFNKLEPRVENWKGLKLAPVRKNTDGYLF